MSTVRTLDGLELHVHKWEAPSPKAAIAIVHGYAEHGARYAEFAEFLNTKSVSVYAVDLRGHGKSPGQRGYVNRYQDYFMDIDALLGLLPPDLPKLLLGHSMGGLAVLDYVLTGGNSGKIQGMLLSSPFFEVALEVPKAKVLAGRVFSRLIPKLSLPSGLKGHEVMQDPELAVAYDRDPLVFGTANARWFTEAMASKDRVFSAAARLSVPTFLLYGEEDKVTAAAATDTFVGRCDPAVLTGEKIPGGFHEILNARPTERQNVYGRYADFVLKCAGAQ